MNVYNHILRLLRKANPSFSCMALIDAYDIKPERLQNLMTGFSDHISDLMVAGKMPEIDGSFLVIEDLLKHYKKQVRQAVVFFFLEHLVIDLRNHHINPAIINQWLRPETKHWLKYLQTLTPDIMLDKPSCFLNH